MAALIAFRILANVPSCPLASRRSECLVVPHHAAQERQNCWENMVTYKKQIKVRPGVTVRRLGHQLVAVSVHLSVIGEFWIFLSLWPGSQLSLEQMYRME